MYIYGHFVWDIHALILIARIASPSLAVVKRLVGDLFGAENIGAENRIEKGTEDRRKENCKTEIEKHNAALL